MGSIDFTPKKSNIDFLKKTGSKENPVEEPLYSNDTERVAVGYGNTPGITRLLQSHGFTDVSKDSSGNIIAKNKNGEWQRDPQGFLHPINWLEARVGGAIPLTGTIAGGLGGAAAGLPAGPGAAFAGGLAAAGALGGLGEALRVAGGKYAGTYEGETPQIVEDIGKQAIKSAALEAGGRAITGAAQLASPYVGPVMGKLEEAINPWTQKLQNFAYEKAGKGIGPYLREVLQLGGKEGVEDLGRAALQKDIIGNIPRGYGVLANRAKLGKEASGQRIGEIEDKIAGYESRGDIPGIPKEQITSDVGNSLLTPNPGLPTTLERNASIQSEIDATNALKEPLLNFNRLRELKKEANKGINWDRLPSQDISNKELFNREYYYKLKKAEEQRAADVERAIENTSTGSFVPEKENYGLMEKIEAIGNKKAARELANRTVSPSDYFSGGLGAVLEPTLTEALGGHSAGNMAKFAGALGLANNLSRRFGNQVIGKQLNNILSPYQTLTESQIAQAVVKNPSLLQLITQPMANQEIDKQSPWGLMGESK